MTSCKRLFLSAIFTLLSSVPVAVAVPVHLWSQGFGDTLSERGTAVAVDAAGNVIVIGGFGGSVDFGGGNLVSVGARDLFVAKYDQNGTHQWSQRFGSSGVTYGHSVAVDDSGNVLIAGIFHDTVDFGGGGLTSAGGRDMFVAKYDATGAHQWSQGFGSASGQDFCGAITADAMGNVIISGYFYNTVDFGGGNLTSGGESDVVIAKYNATGTHLWSQRFGSTGLDRGWAIAVDAAGSVIATGSFEETVDFGGGNITSAGDRDVFLSKYDAAGAHVWSHRFGSTGLDRGLGVAADLSGNAIVTGAYQATVNFGGGNLPADGPEDIFLAKYDTSGTHLWSQRQGGSGSDQAWALAVDGSGNVSVTGNFTGTANLGGSDLTSMDETDVFVARYDSSGGHQWSQSAGGTSTDSGLGVAADASGATIVTGYYSDTADFGGGLLTSAGTWDVFVVKFGDLNALITVTTTADAGVGSIRDAITFANADPDTNLVVFSVPDAAPVTIQLQTELPDITQPVIIDGYTQTGAAHNTNPCGQGLNAVPGITLDGSAIAGTPSGLTIAGDGTTIRGLTVHGFGGGGIGISGDYNTVHGNFVGTDASGTVALGNGATGSGVHVSGDYNAVGGSTPDARNLISGNQSGVLLFGNYNTVAGNLIGTDVTGTSALPNHQDGVRISQAIGNTIGGTSTTDCNVISGNDETGVYMVEAIGARVFGNSIGTDAGGTAALGNGEYGVLHSAVNIIVSAEIGSTVPGEGNTIAHNALDGIYVDPFGIVSGEHTIRANAIHSNGHLGIDIFIDGVTTGIPPQVQSVPVLTSAVTMPASITIDGTVLGPANVDLPLDFFANSVCDGSLYGEGEVYLGSTTVGTDGGGNAVFNETFPIVVSPGSFITATATDTSHAGTSEFSGCLVAINTTAGDSVVVEPVDVTTGTTPVTLTFDSVTTAGNTTLTTSTSGPPAPGNLTVCDSTYYGIVTDVAYTGLIEICIAYDDSCVTGAETDLKLFHYDEFLADWVDITTSLDTIANVVCGEADSLSPFIVTFPQAPSGVDSGSPVPEIFALHPNYPNPFNPSTTINYDVPPGGGRVSIAVFDVAGRLVRVLSDGPQAAGRRSIDWNGLNTRGRRVASGIYFYRMEAGDFVQMRKMVLLK